LNSVILFAQKNIEVNKLDSVGKKIGFWSEIHSGKKTECFYKDGKLNGAIITYYENGELFCLEFYKNDTLVGDAYWFYEKGIIMMSEENISINNSYIINAKSNKVKPVYKSYLKTYSLKGTIESEGTILYDDSPLFESVEYGKWIYYDEVGKIKSVKDYPNGSIIPVVKGVNK
jgi:antitoxin component YwqK of YwqJK toxin-antitoxin module